MNYKYLIASYVTYKEIFSSRKINNKYQIINEFIIFALKNYDGKIINCYKIKEELYNLFNFDIPISVIQNAIKHIDILSSIKSDNNENNYMVKFSQNAIALYNDLEKILLNNINHDNIFNELYVFIKNAHKCELNESDKLEINATFINYLLDIDDKKCKYYYDICKFIVKNTNKPNFTSLIEDIQESCILYTGLMYDIDVNDNLNNDLVLYLDMEILFDIEGYNGLLYKEMANDFLNVVNKCRKIKLRYFEYTKNCIDEFFNAIVLVKNGKNPRELNIITKYLIDKCNDSADVLEEKVRFFNNLKNKYHIYEEEKEDYYSNDEDIKNNLEKIVFNDDIEKNDEYYKYLNCINKLRKGQLYTDYIKSKYIFVTGTYDIVKLSNKYIECIKSERIDKYNYAGYACLLGFITEYLWFKLHKGFGVGIPKSFNAISRAKIILASYKNKNIAIEYKKEISNTDINIENNDNIIKEKTICYLDQLQQPENINSDNVINMWEKPIKEFIEYKKQIYTDKKIIDDANNMIKILEENINDMECAEEKRFNDNILKASNRLYEKISKIKSDNIKINILIFIFCVFITILLYLNKFNEHINLIIKVIVKFVPFIGLGSIVTSFLYIFPINDDKIKQRIINSDDFKTMLDDFGLIYANGVFIKKLNK